MKNLSLTNDLELAALKNLWPLPPCSVSSPKEENVRQAREWAKAKREWADTLSDQRIRNAYLVWIAYVEREANEEEKELRTHRETNAHEEWKRQKKIEDDRAIALMDKIPKPPRP